MFFNSKYELSSNISLNVYTLIINVMQKIFLWWNITNLKKKIK